MPEKYILKQYQALPLKAKVSMSLQRIREWYDHWNGAVCVSFSGGKDSTVLADLVHKYYPDVPLVFVNTGLEYPEIQQFARRMGAEFVKPDMSFAEVISTYGYPLIGKENAEAIYYARRIKNSQYNGGNSRDGGYTTDRKRRELLGQRKIGDEVHNGSAKSTQKAVEKYGAEHRSAYNKQKWLTLSQETQFMISATCCSVMKKNPMKRYQRRNKVYPYVGILTEESMLREQAWVRHGCNSFDGYRKNSWPMSFWSEQDVLHYIFDEGLEIASVYGDLVTVDADGVEYQPLISDNCNLKCSGCDRTGCIFCGFGIRQDKGETRFQRLAKTHPRQYEYCMGGGQWVDNPHYDPGAPEKDGEWTNWNPKKIWVPSKEGLGMKKVFDDCNALYGKDFIRYE